MIGAVGFTSPLLLLGLLALPVLWVLLRAIPPAPIIRMFPAVSLLLGLADKDHTSDRTPWWLLLLRTVAIAALIIGLAGPVLNPDERTAHDRPKLLMFDASWASAPNWNTRLRFAERALEDAARADQTAAVFLITKPDTVTFSAARDVKAQLSGLAPSAWQLQEIDVDDVISKLPSGTFDTLWFSDGLHSAARSKVLNRLEAAGTVDIVQTSNPVVALSPVSFDAETITVPASRSRADGDFEITVNVNGTDPAGTPQVLATLPIRFEAGATTASADLALPAELRARVTAFSIANLRSAGGVILSDDRLQRREVALIAGRADREGLELLSPLHYLRQALEPSADLLSGALMDVLPADPDVIILADVAGFAPAEETALTEWVQDGGVLIRFTGPRMAASDLGQTEEHPLMPVRLRAGGRTVGGAMSWGTPKALAAFDEDSPFFGLRVPSDVQVKSQVLAQPDPTLANRVIASLSDGTPLVTRKSLDRGQIVLFHVTANAEWSSLPLSGLFVQMLDRLAISSLGDTPGMSEMQGTVWQPLKTLNGFGRLVDAGNLPGVTGPDLIEAPLGAALQPGLYQGLEQRIARNVMRTDDVLQPANWPSRANIIPLATREETPLGGILLSLALACLLIDILATLSLSGRLRGAVAVIAIGFAMLQPPPVQAQTVTEASRAATSELVLGHIITRDRDIDAAALAGLQGLSDVLFFRTSIEPDAPRSVDLEQDELAVFPLLYWPITPNQPVPSAEAYAKLNAYLLNGGMILFDTRDADIARFGAASPNGKALRALAAPLNIPTLEPLPADHVLTRTFYLLQDFPGRHTARDLWVEAAPADAKKVDGMPFRNLNDGVTPVIIGGNDWAAAWAINDRGTALYPIGRGYAGERQRELAYRFGVNVVMHVLTGNYKSDQVHVPALLDRLGQ